MSEDEQKYDLPRFLDEPLRLILWTWDEWLVFLVPLGCSFWVFNQFLLGLFLGLLAFFGLKKLKGDQGTHFLKSFFYWHFPRFLQLRCTPASYIREYIG